MTNGAIFIINGELHLVIKNNLSTLAIRLKKIKPLDPKEDEENSNNVFIILIHSNPVIFTNFKIRKRCID